MVRWVLVTLAGAPQPLPCSKDGPQIAWPGGLSPSPARQGRDGIGGLREYEQVRLSAWRRAGRYGDPDIQHGSRQHIGIT